MPNPRLLAATVRHPDDLTRYRQARNCAAGVCDHGHVGPFTDRPDQTLGFAWTAPLWGHLAFHVDCDACGSTITEQSAFRAIAAAGVAA